jgi:hypothetical protein
MVHGRGRGPHRLRQPQPTVFVPCRSARAFDVGLLRHREQPGSVGTGNPVPMFNPCCWASQTTPGASTPTETSGGSQASRAARPLNFAVGIDGVPFNDPAGRSRAPPALLSDDRNDFSPMRGSIVVVDLGGLMEHVRRHLRIGPVSHHALPDDLVEPAGKPIGYREVHAFRHPLPILAVVR